MKTISLLWLLTLTALTVGLLGCKPKTTTLSGQVFIVSQGAASFALGDVEVDLVEKSQVVEFVKKRRAVIEMGIAARKRDFETAQEEVERAQADYKAYLAASLFATNADYVRITAELNDLAQKRSDLAEHSLWAQRDRLRKAAYEAVEGVNPLLVSPTQPAASNQVDAATYRTLNEELVFLDSQASSFFAAGARASVVTNQPPSSEPYQVQAWREFLAAVSKEPSAPADQIDQIDQINSRQISLRDKLASIEAIAKYEAQAQLRAAESRLRAAGTSLKEFLKTSAEAEAALDDFAPVPVMKTRTDADGNFSLTYPRNKAFAIFARVQRAVPTGTENVACWLVNAPSGVMVSKFQLSNSNLIDTDPDGYMKFKDSPPK